MKKPILEVIDLSVSRSGKVIIQDVSLRLNEGEFVAIVGPNGSGKSTFCYRSWAYSNLALAPSRYMATNVETTAQEDWLSRRLPLICRKMSN